MISVTLLLWTVFATSAIVLINVWFSKRRRIAILINKIPGPPTLPILGNMLDLNATSNNEQFLKSLALVQKYRDHGLYRQWMTVLKPSVTVFRQDTVEPLLTSSTNLSKASGYRFLHSWLGTGLLTSTGTKWHSRRKMLTPTFHFKILEEYVPVFNKHTDEFLNKLDQLAEQGPFDIAQYYCLATLDMICDTAMGHGASRTNDGDYVKAVKTASESFLPRFINPLMWRDFIFNRSAVGKRFNHAVDVMHNFTNQIINERRAEYKEKKVYKESEDSNKKRHRSFLDLLLETSEDGKVLSNDDIREEVDTFVFEGHDTTAMGLNWATYLLGHNPEIQERLQEELDRVLQEKQDVTSDDLKELKYLDLVIKESQRIYPSVPGFSRHLDQDLKIGEYTVPKGVNVGVFTYGLHRDPKVFPDPERFDPDRFLPENTRGRSPFAYIPFSAGPRNCIGQKFAMMEMKITLAKFFHKYTVKSHTPRSEMKLLRELILRPEAGTLVSITKRK